MHPTDVKGSSSSDIESGEKHHIKHNDHVTHHVHTEGVAAPDAFSSEVAQAPITEAEVKGLVRKLDWIMLPFMAGTYSLLCIDKNVYGVGSIFGMVQDLGLFVVKGQTAAGVAITDTGRYSNGSSIFWVGYLVGTYPLIVLSQRFPIAKTAGLYTLIWGAVLLLMPLVKNYHGVMAHRFFLGFLESGVSPAYTTMCSMWYTQQEQSFRVVLWSGGGLIGSALSSLVNFGLTKIPHGTAIKTWQIPFLFWGVVTVVFASFALWIVPDTQLNARFLTEREKYVAVERLRVNEDTIKNTHFKWDQIKEAFLDPKVWLPGLIIFSIIVTNGLGTTFSPVIVKSLGFTAGNTLLLQCPLVAIGAIFGLLSGYLGSRFRGLRNFLIMITMTVSLVGNIMLWQIPHSKSGPSLAGIYLSAFYAAALQVALGLVPSNVAGSTKKSFASMIFFTFYALGNIAGPLVFLKSESPTYPSSFKALTVCSIAAVVLAGIYRFLLGRENKRREALGEVAHESRAFQDLTDGANPSFRYVL